MNLGFKQFFDTKKKEPTNFREKILASVGRTTDAPLAHLEPPTRHGWPKKLHTIREDKHNRWKAGRKIEMVYRGPKYSILDHFNKGIPELEKCVSTQKIEIRYLTDEEKEGLKGASYYDPIVKVDGRQLDIGAQARLALNDGFSDDPHVGYFKTGLSKFFLWFNKDFTGKIIHWTDLRY